MPEQDRSLSEVLQNIGRNIQEIVRAEVRLAKTEIREEAVKAKSAAFMLGVGAVTGVFALLFLLFMIVYALALVVPSWAAALIVGAALGSVSIATLTAGVKLFKQVHPTPDRAVETIKENVEWAKQRIK